MSKSVLKLVRQLAKQDEAICGSPESRIQPHHIAPKVTVFERQFLTRVTENHNVRVWRHGWPDFLLQDRDNGAFYAVEVKRGADRINEKQRETFTALDAAGIPVYVWRAEHQGKLTPWRDDKP